MMRMMRSINVAAAVVGYSGVVSCRLLCPLIRPRMIEDNKQFSDYYHPELDAEDEASAVGLMRDEIDWGDDLEGHPDFVDTYHATRAAEYAAFQARFRRSQRERRPDLEHKKNISEYYQDLDAEVVPSKPLGCSAFVTALYAELEVLKKLYHQNPLDVQILRKLAATMTRLATIPTLPVGSEQFEEWILESKSLLEKALDINKNDDNVKFELGIAHFHTLRFDRTLKWGSNSYVEHVLSAYRYFKEVEYKGPEVYRYPMLDILRRSVWPFMSDLESISRNWKSSSSELYHDNTEQDKKEYGDPSNTPSMRESASRLADIEVGMRGCLDAPVDALLQQVGLSDPVVASSDIWGGQGLGDDLDLFREEDNVEERVEARPMDDITVDEDSARGREVENLEIPTPIDVGDGQGEIELELLGDPDGSMKAFKLLLPHMEQEIDELKTKDARKVLRTANRNIFRSFVRSQVAMVELDEQLDGYKKEANRLKEANERLIDLSREDRSTIEKLHREMDVAHAGLIDVVDNHKKLGESFAEMEVQCASKLTDAYRGGYARALANAKIPKSDDVWKQCRSPFVSPCASIPRATSLEKTPPAPRSHPKAQDKA